MRPTVDGPGGGSGGFPSPEPEPASRPFQIPSPPPPESESHPPRHALLPVSPPSQGLPLLFLHCIKKGLSFISNRQRRKEGTFCASGLAGIEPTPPAPKGAGYVRHDHSATVCITDSVNFYLTLLSNHTTLQAASDIQPIKLPVASLFQSPNTSSPH